MINLRHRLTESRLWPRILRMKEQVIKAFEESAEVKRRFVREHADRIVQVAQLIARAFREGRKVLLFGNGGSSTDASHIAAEFVGRYHRDRAAVPSTVTARIQESHITLGHVLCELIEEELFAKDH